MADILAGRLVWKLDVDSGEFDKKLESGQKKIKDAAEKGEKDAEKLESAFTKSGKAIAKSLDEVGKSMIKLGAAPTLALIGVSKAAIDFESSFAGIRKTVDLSEAGFQELGDNLRNIAKQSPVSVNELNHVAELAGQLGISGVDNITKFTETISKFTSATNVAGESAASSFARIANVMQEPIENIDRMGSVVAQLGDSSAATEGEILDFSERIAGAGKIAGLSTANIFSIGAAMASVGVEAEAGGTAVQKVLISMYQAAAGSTSKIIDNSKAISKNSDQLTDLKRKLTVATQRQKEFGDKTAASTKMANANQIEKYNAQIGQLTGKLGTLNATQGQAAISGDAFAKVLGVSNKQFEEMFKKSPDKVFQQFVEKLGDISKKGGDAVGILEGLELGDQRLIRSFLSLSNAGDLLSNQIKVGNKEWGDNNRLNEEAEKRYKTTASQIAIAKNRFYDIGITIGSAVLPSINNLLGALKPVTDQFARWAADNPELIANLLIVGSSVGAIGVALVALSSAVSAVVTLAPVLGAAFTVMLGPVGLIIGAVGLLAAGVIYLGTQTDFFRTKQDLLKQANDRVKASQDALKQSADDVIDANLRVQGTTLALERAQLNYNESVKQYGPKSLEAREAAFQLEQAKKADTDATKAGEKALKNYEEQEKRSIEVQKQHEEAAKSSQTAWGKLTDAIGGAIDKLAEWLTKSGKSPGGGSWGGDSVAKNANGVRNFRGGASIVGEEGPELVTLPRGANVFSNRETKDIFSQAPDSNAPTGRGVTVHVDEMNVRSQSDITDIARELGFRIEMSPGYTENG